MSYVPQQPAAPIAMVPGITHSHADSQRIKYRSTLYQHGIAEIVLGCCAIFLCIISLIYVHNLPYYYGHGFTFVSAGIWCGIFPIISGSFGLCAKKNPSVCIYVTNMVMSIVSACMMMPLFIISCLAAFDPVTGLVAIHSLISLTSFAVLVISIVHSAYCCAGVCCCRESPKAGVVYNPGQPTPNAQYVQLANGQYMLVQNPAIFGQPLPTAPVMQASNQPVVYSQAASSSQVVPQGQLQPQTTMNFTKEQEASAAQLNPQGATSVPPTYGAHSFGYHSQV